MKVAVCDYGAGNVRSVLAALGRIGVCGEATADADAVAAADVTILPGVGSARSAMAELRRTSQEAQRRLTVARILWPSDTATLTK